LIKGGHRTICFDIHKLVNSVWNKEELSEEWKDLIIIPISEKGEKTDCSNYRSMSLFSTTYKLYPASCCHCKLHMQRILMGIISMNFNAVGQLLIIYSAFVKYLRKSVNRMKQCISYS